MTPPLSGVGRIALVTGATSGIGRALAGSLAASGATVAMVARDPERGEQTRAAIVAATGNERVALFIGDLSDMSSVRRLAKTVGDAYATLDILVRCATVYTARRTVTTDGFETMFATNVLGPFLLTNLLLDRARAAGSARILVLSAPSTVKLDFDDLQGERRFRSLTAFGATKAADLLLTFELARRLAGTRVTANAVHPGLSRTTLMREAPAPLRWATRLASAPPERAAAQIVPLALAPEYADRSGRFLGAGREIQAPPYTRDPEVARRLWDACTALTNIGQSAPSLSA